ncbi:MAG: HesA/MoeB/ThiF family protein, partial [Methanomicrobiales archaeon]|nr:HesA/MoeB/ThiF family protein [Methanomicrobiales archaeon]
MCIDPQSNISRYTRQIPLIGQSGQEKLAASHVCIVGVGGLGSPVALYLAAAGVGTLSIIDEDIVSLSNLNRQILHTTPDLGRAKVDSGAEKLRTLNPDIVIHSYHSRITPELFSTIASEVDLVIDAVDNYQTRHILNEVCVKHTIPFLHGAVQGFTGQMMLILPRKTACLYCFLSSCETTHTPPVIGTTPGIIGVMQANEAIKFLVKIKNVTPGVLILWDGITLTLEKCIVER